MEERSARFANAATEQATKERLEAKRQVEWAAVQRANEENVRQKALVGTCQSMCPEYEREKRQRESAVDAFEKDPVTGRIDPAKAVKSFMRPSQQDIVPSDLRPPNILKLTLDYLLHDVMSSAPFSKTLSFIWDRMRSIRQDLTIQNSRGPDAIELLERLARYYIIAIHEMRGDPALPAKLTNDQLNGTLKSLAEMYKEARHRGEEASPNEAEFYSYYLVFAYDSSTLYQINQLPPALLEDSHLQLALRICALMERNNRKQGAHSGRNSELGLNAFSRFFKRIASEETPYLIACVFEAHFADVRLGGLTTLNRAYHIRTELSLIELAKRLGCDDDAHCATVCRDYNVPLVMEGDVPVAAVLHNKYTEMDEHTRKLLPFGLPSRRLIDNKRRGASFAELCDGKTGDAPPTPVTAPSSRLIPKTPTPIRSPFAFQPAITQSPASPFKQVETPSLPSPQTTNQVTAPIAPFAFTSTKPIALPESAPKAQPAMLPPPLPAAAPPLVQKEMSAEPVLKAIEVAKQPAPASAPSVRTSPHLGKRKASSTAQDSPPLRRAAPLPAAVLRKQRLDAFAPPLAERLLEAALDQLIRDAAIDTQLDQNARHMSLQKTYREAMINACADELMDLLLDEAVKELAISSVIDQRLLNQALIRWQNAYEDACEEHEIRQERESSLRAAVRQIGKISRYRSATVERDVDELLRIGNLDLAPRADTVSMAQSLMEEEEDGEDLQDVDLWTAGTLVQPLLARADASALEELWTALIVVKDEQSISADWWRCKTGMAGGATTMHVPPLDLRIVQLDALQDEDLESVGLVILDVTSEIDQPLAPVRSLVDSLATRLQRECHLKPDLLVVDWTSQGSILDALLSDISRSAFIRCVTLQIDLDAVDAPLGQAIKAAPSEQATKVVRGIDQQRQTIVAGLFNTWADTFKKTLSSANLPPSALLTVIRRYQEALIKSLSMLFDKLATLAMPTIERDAPSVAHSLQTAVINFDHAAFDGFIQTLLVVPAVDDIILALSYLEHFGQWLLPRVLMMKAAEADEGIEEQMQAGLEQELATIAAFAKQSARPASPAKSPNKSKRLASSPISRGAAKTAKRDEQIDRSPHVSSISKLNDAIRQAKTLLEEQKGL